MSIQLKPGTFRQRIAGDYVSPVVSTLAVKRSARLEEVLEPWSTDFAWDEVESVERLYPSIRPGMILRELREDLTVHDPITVDIHRFNRSAAAILLLCNGSRSVEEIAYEYASFFSLEQGSGMADVRRIVGELIEKKVVIPRQR